MSIVEKLVKIRVEQPELIAQRLAERSKLSLAQALHDQRKLMIIACDHPARGMLGAGDQPRAMENREELLQRCLLALSRPGVNGFLGTADLIEDLTLLGALDNKLVFGSMNRAGLSGATFTFDDRFNCYQAAAIKTAGLTGGKFLLRINYQDPATAATLEAAGKAISELAEQKLLAMVEPFISTGSGAQVVNDLSPQAVAKSAAIASGLGCTSAYTWLKLPCVPQMGRVLGASALPALILGGEVSRDLPATLASWGEALSHPTAKGLVIGRSILFPPGDDVAGTVDEAVSLL